MRRGENPIIEFEFDFDTNLLEVAYITFKQNNEVMFRKTLDECTCEGQFLCCQITQEESLKLAITKPNDENMLKVQAKVKTNDGSVLISPIKDIKVEEAFEEGVI